jgi:hypothetical protein
VLAAAGWVWRGLTCSALVEAGVCGGAGGGGGPGAGDRRSRARAERRVLGTAGGWAAAASIGVAAPASWSAFWLVSTLAAATVTVASLVAVLRDGRQAARGR